MRRLAMKIPWIALGLSPVLLAACSGGSHNTNNRVAFVEVTSTPSGQPVEIRLNKITLHATTPVAQNVHYDADCTPLTTPTPTSPRDCALVGAASWGSQRG
jgi:hypothetical protein